MTTLEQVNQQEVEQKTSLAVQKANGLTIDSNPSYESAAEMLKAVKSLQKEVKATFDPVCKATNDAWKAATAARKKHSEPLETAEGIIKRKLGTYHQEQEKKRLEVEQRERERLKREAEDERLEAATNAEAAGDDAAAEQLLNAPIIPAPVRSNFTPPKVAGVAQRTNWKFEIIDVDKIPREHMEPNMTSIGGVVRALKDQANIPGVRAYADRGVSARG